MDYRSSSCQPSQQPVTVNSYITNHEGVDEGDDQQQDTMPYYEQPQQIIVSLVCTLCMQHDLNAS